MKKIDAVRLVSQKTGLSQANTKKIMETLLKEIESALANGSRVEFRGFGIWEVKMARAHTGRNPAKPGSAPIHIPARPRLRFILSQNLKSVVRSIPAERLAET